MYCSKDWMMIWVPQEEAGRVGSAGHGNHKLKPARLCPQPVFLLTRYWGRGLVVNHFRLGGDNGSLSGFWRTF
jgi:hypothetical protein